MKKSVFVLMAALVSANALAAPKAAPRITVEVKNGKETEKDRNVDPNKAGSTATGVDGFREYQSRMSAPVEQKTWASIRVEDILNKASLAIDAVTKRNLIEASNNDKSLEIRQAVNTLDSAVNKLSKNGNGRLTNEQQALVQEAIEWLAECKGEGDIHDIHMVLEDALKSESVATAKDPGYAVEVTKVIKQAREYKRSENQKGRMISSKEAMKRVLEGRENPIKEEDLRLCNKG